MAAHRSIGRGCEPDRGRADKHGSQSAADQRIRKREFCRAGHGEYPSGFRELGSEHGGERLCGGDPNGGQADDGAERAADQDVGERIVVGAGHFESSLDAPLKTILKRERIMPAAPDSRCAIYHTAESADFDHICSSRGSMMRC